MRRFIRNALAVALAMVLLLQLFPSAAIAEEAIGAVKINAGSNAKVRDRASFDGKNVGEAKAGREYDLLENTGEWYKIRLDEKTVGWIYNTTAQVTAKAEKPAEAEVKATATPASAVQSAEVSGESVSIGALLRGQPVVLLERDGLTVKATKLVEVEDSVYYDGKYFALTLEISNANPFDIGVDFSYWSSGLYDEILLNGEKFSYSVLKQGQSRFDAPLYADIIVPAQAQNVRYNMEWLRTTRDGAALPALDEVKNGQMSIAAYLPTAEDLANNNVYSGIRKELFVVSPLSFDMDYLEETGVENPEAAKPEAEDEGNAAEALTNVDEITIPVYTVDTIREADELDYPAISARFENVTLIVNKAYCRLNSRSNEYYVYIFGEFENDTEYELALMVRTDLSTDYVPMYDMEADINIMGAVVSGIWLDQVMPHGAAKYCIEFGIPEGQKLSEVTDFTLILRNRSKNAPERILAERPVVFIEK